MRSWVVVVAVLVGGCSFTAAHVPGGGAVTGDDAPDGPPPSTARRIKLPGAIDEVRISNIQRSTARLAAESATERDDPVTPFVSFGAPEPVP